MKNKIFQLSIRVISFFLFFLLHDFKLKPYVEKKNLVEKYNYYGLYILKF